MTESARQELKPGDDLQMMQSPDEWPLWPRLPLKRTTPDGKREHGFLFDRLMHAEFAWFANKSIYDRINVQTDKPVLIKKDNTLAANLQKLLDDGWVVD